MPEFTDEELANARKQIACWLIHHFPHPDVDLEKLETMRKLSTHGAYAQITGISC